MNLNGIDLNLLVALDALLDERSVTRAAERLSIGQPAMSAALARLRKLFDDPLLTRDGAGLVASPLAESLVEPVRGAIRAIREVLGSRDEFDPATSTRTFTVVASDYVGLVLLSPLLRRLTRAAPGIRLVIRPVAPDFLAELRREQVDLLVVPRELLPEQSGHRGHELFRDRYVCAVAADDDTVGDTISAEDFASRRHLVNDGGRLPALGQRHLPLLGAAPAVQISTQTSLLAPFLVSGTDLVTVLPELLGKQLSATAGIRLVDPPYDLGQLTETMFWDPRRTTEPGLRWLRGQLREVAGRLRRPQT